MQGVWYSNRFFSYLACTANNGENHPLHRYGIGREEIINTDIPPPFPSYYCFPIDACCMQLMNFMSDENNCLLFTAA
jgi:hypothetical protein